MAGRIFISHSAADRPQIDPLLRRLEARGISVWIAPDDVRPGIDYPVQTHKAIEDCAALVVVITETSNNSRYVQAETELAFSSGKEIFPIRLSDIRPGAGLALFLNMVHWTDAFGARRYEQLDRLANELLALADPTRPAPPVTPARSDKGGRSVIPLVIAGAVAAAILIGILISQMPTSTPRNDFAAIGPVENFSELPDNASATAAANNALPAPPLPSPALQRGSEEELKQAIQGRWDLVSDSRYQCSPPDLRISLGDDQRTIRYTYPDPNAVPVPSCISSAGGDQIFAWYPISCDVAATDGGNYETPNTFYRLSPDRQTLFIQSGPAGDRAPPEETYRRCP